MDAALPPEETIQTRSILDSYETQGVSYHSLCSRAAARKFMAIHLLVPGDWTVRRGHQLAEQIEQKVMRTVRYSNIVTHIEPIENPISHVDMDLDSSRR